MKNLKDSERELYSRKKKISSRKRQGVKKSLAFNRAKRDWGGAATVAPRRKKKKSFGKTMFIFSLGFFGLSVLFMLFQFVAGNPTISTKNIDIEVLGNSFTEGGEELPLQIQITNRNSVALEQTDVLLEYPDGAGDTVRDRVTVGIVKPGQTIVEARDIVLFGQQGVEQEIVAGVEFRTKGSNALLFKEISHFVTLNSAPIDLTVEGPETVVAGQRATFTVRLQANNDTVSQNMGVRVEYPTGFRFDESSIEPAYGDNVWQIGDLGIGVEKTLTFSGDVFGQEGEERSFRFFIGPYGNNSSSELASTYNSFVHTVLINRPFIDTQILVDGIDNEEYTKQAQEPITVNIKWENNFSSRIDDVVLEVALDGDILNQSSIRTNGGFYDSNSNTIRWDKNTYPRFASVQPGSRDTISFDMASLPLYSNGILSSEAQIDFTVSFSGKKPTEGGSLDSIENSTERVIKITSDLYLAADAYYRDGPFTNSGPLPPVAGQETTYTITLSVSNSANAIGNAQVKTTLPQYVVYKSAVSPATEQVIFDPITREVTWSVGAIPRGAGLTSVGEEVSFQVGFTPSISQVQSGPLLTDDIVLTGRDLFTNTILRNTQEPVSIRLQNDSNYSGSEGIVVAP
jgi:hypothetical protein